ncbi:MAG TPA: threonine--tRNA ligase [Pseudomonadales bacterium]|nr:threonine--tRNA ligase [Gammaproteobacteria bacterium]HIM34329.1 threonine--tRNA ligase [Pseudomonadales bacterium]
MDDALYRIRHSLAHVLAQAVLEIRPGSTLGFGPPIKDGFYYDFILSEPLTDEDFPKLEQAMRRIIKKGQRFYREELSRDDALNQLSEMNEPYKREYALELLDRNDVSELLFYRNGPFLDMCEGPHVDTTRDIPRDCFKLRSVAGAYWRGDSDNVMMTRIYAWAFSDKATLDLRVDEYEQALLRDHKKLGRELGIYAIDNDIGRGLPLWLPNGTVIRDELEKLAKELEFKANYQRVATPHIARRDLFYQTGHLPYYADGMYPPMELTEEGDDGERIKEAYVLKPMNCPHHHKIFSSEPRSYRDLPLRFAEYGQVYRFEESGAVGGLMRVRGMSMNDAHIYCTEDQVKSEFRNVMALHDEAYAILGLDNYYLRLSRRDPHDPKGKDKYVDDPKSWETCERLITELLNEMEVEYVDGPGEAAFYGPKIDMQFHTVTGRDESVSTIQLDFAVPRRLGLHYVGSDGADHVPYCIHRAPFSTHERFVAFLIEHFAGAFPTWLAPVQVRVLTVSNQFTEYGQQIVDRLRARFIRAELGSDSDTVSKKIRDGTTQKIPNLLIVGEREAQNSTVTLRRYGIEKQETLSIEALEHTLVDTIKQRSLELQLS